MDAFYFCGDALNVKTWPLGPYHACDSHNTFLLGRGTKKLLKIAVDRDQVPGTE